VINGKWLFLPASAAALFAVAACNSEPEAAQPVTTEQQLAEAGKVIAPVQLPPMLSASRTYRCKDNSLVYIDFFNDDATVHLKTEKAGPITILAAAEPGKPYVAPGYSLTGNGANVELVRPDRPLMVCKA
jgi:hypothetical protein